MGRPSIRLPRESFLGMRGSVDVMGWKVGVGLGDVKKESRTSIGMRGTCRAGIWDLPP